MTTETITDAPETGEVDTTEKLATLGDDIKRAQEERWHREQQEKRQQRNRVFAENRIRQIEQEIPKLKEAIDARQPAVEELERRFEEQKSTVASMLDERGHVPFSKVAEYNAAKEHLDELGRAFTQAWRIGSELVEGASAIQGGDVVTSYAPKSIRLVHPLLQELGGGGDFWATPLAPLTERLAELTAERDKLTKRLGK